VRIDEASKRNGITFAGPGDPARFVVCHAA
jgi:hypothetical protein